MSVQSKLSSILRISYKRGKAVVGRMSEGKRHKEDARLTRKQSALIILAWKHAFVPQFTQRGQLWIT